MSTHSLRYVLIRVFAGSLLIVSPMLVTPLYLHLSYLWNLETGPSDLVAGVTIIAIGVTGICLLPMHNYWRAFAITAYTVCLAQLLLMWSFDFNGGL